MSTPRVCEKSGKSSQKNRAAHNRNGNNDSLLLVCVVCLLALSCAQLSFGQATTGTISGVVSDQTAATVPEAVVMVRNLNTNATRSVATESDGRFNFPGLPVGPYEVTVEKTGFGKFKQGPIVLLLNQVAVVNVTLRPAGVAETVTVTEDAPLLNTTNPEVGVRFDTKRLSDLPTNSQAAVGGGGFRDAFAFALSAPGVSQPNSGNSSFASGTNFSVNGSRPRGNNFMIDGQDSNDPSVTGRQQSINNTDIVQEFRLITNQFAPEYGRAAGSIVNVVTKSGTNQFHGSAFWFYGSNAFNARNNLDKATGFLSAPFYNEHQYGGTVGGPIFKDKTFFFGSLQRWTIRQFAAGTTISGVPTVAGKTLLQSTVGSRPQVAALLRFVPGAAVQDTASGNPTFAAFCLGGGTLPSCTGGTRVNIPTGSITGVANSPFNSWQASGRVDHRLNNMHSLGGRYLFSDTEQSGTGQATPPGFTTDNLSRTQALTSFLTSNFTPRTLNEVRLSWQRLASNTTPTDPASLTIPSIEIPELGLTGFNSDRTRTAIGLAVNQPQYRFNNTYQLQETLSLIKGAHALKFGIDFRRVDVKSFFVPTIRGRLTYPTPPPGGLARGTVSIQRFVDDLASVADINQALPGGVTINYYKWYDYFFFAQDTWAVTRTLSLTYGLRYETPGNALASLYPLNDRIVQTNGGSAGFLLSPRPSRDLNNFQPRVGFSWNPRFSQSGILGMLSGGDKLVVRGGYARTNDYQFINLALNVASSFPFLAASSRATGANPLANAFVQLPLTVPDLSNPARFTRTVLASDFRSPIAEQFSLEIQRQFMANNVLRIGYVGTKGTGLFQTLDGNPVTRCPLPLPPAGCPRVNPNQGVIRLRANAASSIYHSLQISYDRRFASGFSAGAHYTWSAFIDDASDTFNPSARGEVAIPQDSFNRVADRARSTYDRPHRFSANLVYELPFYRNQAGALGHILGGFQVATFATFQSGSPWSPLNGSDPFGALGGISGLVGDAVRPLLNTDINIWGMSAADVRAAGGSSLFRTLTRPQDGGTVRLGNVGRNILRSDRLKSVDFSISKTTRITEAHKIQLRLDMFNLTNTRNFGIPEARITNPGFADQTSTNGGARTMYVALKYLF